MLIEAKIIVLDEATASVDVETDRTIQEVLRRECRDQTVITIAHRLATLSDYDEIIEVRQGEVLPVRRGRGEGNWSELRV